MGLVDVRFWVALGFPFVLFWVLGWALVVFGGFVFSCAFSEALEPLAAESCLRSSSSPSIPSSRLCE